MARPILRPAKEPPLPKIQHPAGHPRNSDDGREVMLRDLEAIHENLLRAYKAVLLFSGVDLEKLVAEYGDSALPSGHLPIST